MPYVHVPIVVKFTVYYRKNNVKKKKKTMSDSLQIQVP